MSMEWLPIESFIYPEKSWDFDSPRFFVYSPTKGYLAVKCIKEDDGSDDADSVTYSFRYDRDGYEVTDVTHFMIPTPPKEAQR